MLWKLTHEIDTWNSLWNSMIVHLNIFTGHCTSRYCCGTNRCRLSDGSCMSHSHTGVLSFSPPPTPRMCLGVISMQPYGKVDEDTIFLHTSEKVRCSFGRDGQAELKMLLLFWDLGILFLGSKWGKTIWNWWSPWRGGVGGGDSTTQHVIQIGERPRLLQIWSQGEDFKYRVAATIFFLPSVEIFSYFLDHK